MRVFGLAADRLDAFDFVIGRRATVDIDAATPLLTQVTAKMDDESLCLQPAKTADSQFIWEVNNAPATRAQSINADPIPGGHINGGSPQRSDPIRMWVALSQGVVGVIDFADATISALSVAPSSASRTWSGPTAHRRSDCHGAQRGGNRGRDDSA